MAARQFDKYYTKRSIAKQLKAALFKIIDPAIPILEPSVGGGSFIEPKDGIVGFDLKPEHFGALQIDSLSPHIPEIMRWAGQNEFLSIGNPPFGKNSDLAIQFVNQFLAIGHIVAFVVPITFRKWSVQSQIMEGARLILDLQLPEFAFELPDGTPYGLRTCFQAWTVRDCDRHLPDLRLMVKPPTAHADFKMDRYNATKGAAKYVGQPWDIAVPAQGHADYGLRLRHANGLNTKAQWMFFTAPDSEVLDRIDRINFAKLSRRNMITPGFGKADVVEAYSALLASDHAGEVG